MPKRSRTPNSDPTIAAAEAVARLTGSPAPAKNPAAVALGRLGGAKGGKARAEALTPKRRSAIARKAAEARWHKGDNTHS